MVLIVSKEKGFICRVMANAYAPWFINPNKALELVMSVGVEVSDGIKVLGAG